MRFGICLPRWILTGHLFPVIPGEKGPPHVRQGMKGGHAMQSDICAWHLKGAEEGHRQPLLEVPFSPRLRCLPLLAQGVRSSRKNHLDLLVTYLKQKCHLGPLEHVAAICRNPHAGIRGIGYNGFSLPGDTDNYQAPFITCEARNRELGEGAPATTRSSVPSR